MEVNCLSCGKPFVPDLHHGGTKKYCSDYCRSKQWRIDNRDKDLLCRKRYNEKRKLNPEDHKKDLECRRLWRLHNRDKKYSYKRAYRARKYGNGGRHTKKEWEELKVKFDFACNICGKKEPEIKLTEDHILPLSRGGTDEIVNIQPLCKVCNSTKNDRISSA